MMATHCLRIQSCNCLAICRALTRSSRNQVHTETSVRFHCLTPPHLLFQPHLAPSDSHTYHIKTSPPTKPATAALCFQREAILLLKNPLLEELSHALLYCFTSFSPRTFITSCKTVSTQWWHGIIQSLTDPLARMSQFQTLLYFSQKRTVKPLFSLCLQQVSMMSQRS